MVALIDSMLSDYDFRTAHSRWIDAAPDRVWSALTSVKFDELTLTRPLVRIRGLGKKVPSGTVFHDGPVTLLEVHDGEEAVAGSIAQSWALRPRHLTPRGPDHFRTFADPGWVKFVTDFRVVPENGGTRLSTETRVKATDESAKLRFALYWAGIRTFSGVVRRDVLGAVARRAVAA